MKEQSVINQAAKQGSIEIFGYDEGDYTIPFGHGAKWAIAYCNQVIRKVLERYEPYGALWQTMKRLFQQKRNKIYCRFSN